MEVRQKISAEQAASELNRSVETLDEFRALQLAESLRVESAKGNVYTREHARLLRKYGKEHPRTMDLESRMKGNKAYQAAIVTEYQNAATPRPEPGKGWVLDGFVRSADGRAIPAVTVALYDRANKWHQEFGHACTDQNGYFSLLVGRLPEKPANPLFVRASKEKRILPSRDLPVLPKAGATHRVEIILGAQDGKKEDCMPPDGRIPPTRMPSETVVPVKGPEGGTGGKSPTPSVHANKNIAAKKKRK